jgi:transcriptional regulator with XRE-family HTH domain
VTPNYVGVLERGEKLPTLETLVVIARRLGVGVAELVGDEAKTDPWVDEVVAVASSVPKGSRNLALAVLRAVATTRGHASSEPS